MYICKICDQRFDQIPVTAEKLSQSIYRFDDSTVHILSKRKKIEPLTETTHAPDECRTHYPLTSHIKKSDCPYCIASNELKE
jgi:hypothetical protein